MVLAPFPKKECSPLLKLSMPFEKLYELERIGSLFLSTILEVDGKIQQVSLSFCEMQTF
jgi:hypothetical protein